MVAGVEIKTKNRKYKVAEKKRGKKKRGAHFWEVDVQSDLDFRRLVKTMKKNVLFLKKRKIAQKTKTRKKKRGADLGNLISAYPKTKTRKKNAEHKSGCSAFCI